MSRRTHDRILRPGANCWRISPSDRVAFLQDARDYFDALADALDQARRRIFIVGWDFDSRIVLRPHAGANITISEHLRRLVEERPTLEVFVLVWRGSLFYGDNSELANLLVGDWWRHPRVFLKFDDQHPFGACHHQKIVTIDDSLAFIGGIDLTRRRWDDSAHSPDHEVRRSGGDPYPPVHDLQAMLDGEAARAISRVVRDRWAHAGGDAVEDAFGPNIPWPAHVRPDITDHSVAIVRTNPKYNGNDEIREIESLVLSSLEAAHRSIYIETQYFTLAAAAEILADHLRRPDGPEIIIVVTRRAHSRLEEYAMGQERDRLFAELCEADRHDRLGLFYPVSRVDPPCEITVHSKLLVIDERFVRIGSANLNHRSMGVDTECDIAIEAETDGARRAIGDLRARLIAEHVDIPDAALKDHLAREPSLLRAIARFNSGERRLMPCIIEKKPETPSSAPGKGLLDPSSPLELTDFGAGFVRTAALAFTRS